MQTEEYVSHFLHKINKIFYSKVCYLASLVPNDIYFKFIEWYICQQKIDPLSKKRLYQLCICSFVEHSMILIIIVTCNFKSYM